MNLTFALIFITLAGYEMDKATKSKRKLNWVFTILLYLLTLNYIWKFIQETFL